MRHKKTKRSNLNQKGYVQVPRNLILLFVIAVILLVPWMIWMSLSLPADHLDRRWNVAWSGFDIGLLVSLAMTAGFGWRKSGWVILAASMSGSFLLIDAWFDSVTAKRGWEYVASTSSAVFVELPLALLSFWIAYRAGRHFFGK